MDKFLEIRAVGCVMLSPFSRVRLFVTLWTVAHQAPLSMGVSRQEYWSGLPFPPPGDLPDPGIEPASPVHPALQADILPLSYGEALLETQSLPKMHQEETDNLNRPITRSKIQSVKTITPCKQNSRTR